MQTYQKRAESHAKSKSMTVDDQTVFYVFRKVVQREYGARGEHNLEAKYFKDKKLFVSAKTSLWASELQQNRQAFIDALNKDFGLEAVLDIKVESAFR